MRFPWNRMEADLKRELEHHLHQLTAEYERRGHSHEDAMWMAKREFGGSEQVKEMCRDERRWAWMFGIWQDFAFALRHMRRSPGFAGTAVLTLALGIAANVIVFGVLQALVLRPLDVPHADRLMTLARTDQTYPILPYPEVRDVRDGNTVFSAVAAWSVWDVGLEANGVTRPVWAFPVNGQYFEAVAIKPFLGRLLERADDDHPEASQAAVLSWPSWQSYFGADPNIVGKTIRLNKHPYTIVGVTPEGFYGTEKFIQPAIFVPMANAASFGEGDLESRGHASVWSVVRIKDGVTTPQVQTELNTIAAGIRRRYPKDEEKAGFKLTRPGLMGDFLGAPARAFLAGVMVLAGILLLAACANLGSLFAARTADRTREIAIRMAIGSSRWRIVRQVLVEALVISILGGACACGLAWMALTSLAAWHPPTTYPIVFFVRPQPSLILMALLISVLAGVLFGVMPLRQIFKTDPNDSIKSGGNQSFRGRRWALRDVLLAAQIALCCVTVTAAFVSLRGLGKALTMDLGFNPKHAVVTTFELSQAGYLGAAADQFQRRLLERVSQLPGVVEAGYANSTPLNEDTTTSSVFSQQTADFRASNRAFYCYDYAVSPGYFTAARTPLLAGRDVSFADTPKTPPVAVVNQQFARRLFHSEHAVGRYFKNSSGLPIQIVGVVADGKYLTLSEDPSEVAFFPISQEAATKTSLVVRIRPEFPDAATNDMAGTIRKVIRDLDPSVPIRESSAWNSQLGMTFFLSRVATAALGIFGAFGLLLSIAGTFGLASYTVSKRLRELSIRVALGADAKQVLSAALGRMLIVLGSGSVVGIVLGVAASRLLSAIVYQASAQDPFVLAAVAFTVVLTGSLSVAGPVRRALHIDPATLLREQ
jgi:predicted permease